MSFDNEASNADNDRARNAAGPTIGDVLEQRWRRAAEQDYAVEWLEESDWDALTDSVVEAFDGCGVEPDGSCEHGYSSPLIVLGIL